MYLYKIFPHTYKQVRKVIDFDIVIKVNRSVLSFEKKN